MNYGDHIIPLVIGKIELRETESAMKVDITIDRYAGVSFFVGEEGRIATCKHIVEMVQDDEVLLGKNLITGEIKPVGNIRVHPIYDFALGTVSHHKSYICLPIGNKESLIGQDVRAFGFTYSGRNDNDVSVDPRLFKGHIVRISPNSNLDFAKSIMELSFPSHKGFSGGPIISENTGRVVGMLYGNQESSIEMHSFLDTAENGEVYKEGMFRIIELGLAHSASDISLFIQELESC
jgi:hypothetical protein